MNFLGICLNVSIDHIEEKEKQAMNEKGIGKDEFEMIKNLNQKYNKDA